MVQLEKLLEVVLSFMEKICCGKSSQEHDVPRTLLFCKGTQRSDTAGLDFRFFVHQNL